MINRSLPIAETHLSYRDQSPGVHARTPLAIFSGILFLSGIGALIFETLWVRLSGLAFGNSVWSAALILSSFMAGLALGNAIAASSRIRRWRPLYLYSFLELLVAVLGCTIVFALPALGELLRPVWQILWNSQPILLGVRFVVSFLILLMPTTAMGLTLPVLIEDPMLRQTSFGRAIGFLYGSNTLGAVAGALLGESYLIGAFGLRGTSVVAGLASCIAAAIALFVAKRNGCSATRVLQRTFPFCLEVKYRPPWRLLFVSFGTGCVLLALEVIWFRFLRLYIASSPTAFALMLALVLGGIGLGSVLASLIHQRPVQVDRLLPILLLLAAILVLLSYLFFPSGLVPTSVAVFDLSWLRIALLSMGLMFPVALLSGILFPCIATSVQAAVGDRMNSAGVATLFNTIGAALGPLLASFLLLPLIGYQWSLIACAAAYALLSIVSAFTLRPGIVSERSTLSQAPKNAVAFGVLIALWIVLAFVLAIFPYRRAETHFAHASRPYETENQGQPLAHTVKRIEGTSDTWQLLRRDFAGEPYYYRLLCNAFSMSATNPPGQRYMRLFAYLPLAFRPESQNVLLICFGCGVTADALLHGLNVKQMDVVDISKEVIRLADSYSGMGYTNPLRDPRATTFIQDGRFFLQAAPRQYDIISGEPPPPKNAGSVNLYSKEFFSLMKGRLKEGGIATFWLPLDQLKLNEAKAILRAFHDVFPNASVWADADENWIMMGINGPGRKISEEELRRLWKDPATGPDLRRIGIEVPQQLGALFLMDGDEIDRVTRNAAPLTDDYPKRLSDAPWDDKQNFEFAASYMEPSAVTERFQRSPLIERIWPAELSNSIKSIFAVRETRFLSKTVGSNKLAELDLFLRGTRLRMPVLETLGSDELRLAIAQRVAQQTESPPIQVVPDLIAGALAQRDVAEAIRLLETQKERGAFGPREAVLLTYLYCLAGNIDKAETLVAANSALINKDPSADWLWKKLETDFGFHPPH
jgi:spermidine synthase